MHRLEDMLAEYTELETIDEYGCRRCSIHTTRSRLEDQLATAKANDGKTTMSASKKKRIRELQRTLTRLEEVIQLEDYERDLRDLPIKIERHTSTATKQVMFCTPPKLLVLHLSRSSYYEGSYGHPRKNNCLVQFPEHLSMDPYTTSIELSMEPHKPISTPVAAESAQGLLPRYQYALVGLVVHVGNHHSGHYLTFRRRPTRPGAKLSKHWFRISDEDVEVSSAQEALNSNPFLLFYERLDKQEILERTSV
jgi:ubiquitin carboxyl-terminal hydrolase 1